MSETPPPGEIPVDHVRDRTPELTSSKRERRNREDDDGDKDRSHQRRRRDGDGGEENDRDKERRHRHRDGEERERERDGGEDGHRRRRSERDKDRRDDGTEEEREERRRRRRERDREDRDGRRERDRGERRGSHHTSVRDRSRESHKSHKSREVEGARPIRELSRDDKDRERERREVDERREAVRRRDERFDMDRERERERRMRDRPPFSPPRRRASPSYDQPPPPPPPREPPPPKDPVTQLLDEVDSESRSIFVSQLAARLTSSDLGLFFEDKLGRGSVRDARVVTDRVSRRSKGIGYVELDAVELVNRALALSGTVVMGIPISINVTEAERNRQGQVEAMMNGTYVPPTSASSRPQMSFGGSFPPLSTGLKVSAGIDVDAHSGAAIPYHRLFVSNLSPSLAGNDIRAVFEAFGDIEFVDCHTDFSGNPKGTAYVQFKDLRSAQMALDAMAGFELAGRTIRVQTIQERPQVAEQIEDAGQGQGYGPKMDNTQRQQLMFKLARTEPNVNLSLSANRSSSTPAKTSLANPTPFVVVSNMFNAEDETERNWDLDLAEDVKGEVEGKYGKLKRIKVEKMSAGEVYLEFENIKHGEAAIKGLNGRFFGGRQLAASFITEALFKAHL